MPAPIQPETCQNRKTIFMEMKFVAIGLPWKELPLANQNVLGQGSTRIPDSCLPTEVGFCEIYSKQEDLNKVFILSVYIYTTLARNHG